VIYLKRKVTAKEKVKSGWIFALIVFIAGIIIGLIL